MMKTDSASPANMLRLLHPLSAVALIVGIVIGAGIFKTPSLVASISGDAGWALVLWLAGALISIVGALCYAELCTELLDATFLSFMVGRAPPSSTLAPSLCWPLCLVIT
jgi:amino acid transporter